MICAYSARCASGISGDERIIIASANPGPLVAVLDVRRSGVEMVSVKMLDFPGRQSCEIMAGMPALRKRKVSSFGAAGSKKGFAQECELRRKEVEMRASEMAGAECASWRFNAEENRARECDR
jgi:hypothetical protein